MSESKPINMDRFLSPEELRKVEEISDFERGDHTERMRQIEGLLIALKKHYSVDKFDDASKRFPDLTVAEYNKTKIIYNALHQIASEIGIEIDAFGNAKL